jgi:hypothetical protein
MTMSSRTCTTYLCMQDRGDNIVHDVHPNILVQLGLVDPVLGSAEIRSGLLDLG